MATRCSKHSGQPYVMVCYSCDKSYQFVCCECIVQEHKGHQLETFKTAANNVLDNFRKNKANILPTLKEIQVKLKNCATFREDSKNNSENTRQYINERREQLKAVIDETAEKQLQKQESSDKRFMDVLVCWEQQLEYEVKKLLEFQSKLATLETSPDNQQVIHYGKQMNYPNISKSHCPIPTVPGHTLRCQKTLDRRHVRQLFGEEVEEDMRNSYILHRFDGRADSDTESVCTEDLFASNIGSINGQDAEPAGNMWHSRRMPQVDHPNDANKFETRDTSVRTSSLPQLPNWSSTLQVSQYQPQHLSTSSTFLQSEKDRQVSTKKIGQHNTFSNVYGGRTSLNRLSVIPPVAQDQRLPPNNSSAQQTKDGGSKWKMDGKY